MDSRILARVALVVVSAAVLQLGVASRFRLWDVMADLLLLAAVAAAAVVGPDRGAVTGFACGLLVDLQTQAPFGLRALVFSLVAFAVGRFARFVVRSSRATVMITGFVATALGQVAYAVLANLLGQSPPPPGRVAVIAVVCGVWNGLFAPVMVRAMRWAWREPGGVRVAFR